MGVCGHTRVKAVVRVGGGTLPKGRAVPCGFELVSKCVPSESHSPGVSPDIWSSVSCPFIN